MPATIRDVAKKAGVGLGTVSRVINQSPQVSQETRQRVQQAIDALNYRPNPIARRLSWGKTLTIAAIAPFFTRPATIERLRGVELSITGTEYDLIVFNVETPERRDFTFDEVARRERVDGALIISLPPALHDLDRFHAASIPIVLVDVNHPELTRFNRVIVDDVAGGYKATRHLLQIKHRRIAYISDSFDDPFHFSASRYRFEGYQKALEEAGIAIDPRLHRHGDHGRYEAERLASEMLRLREPPTAIFAASDTQALGVLEAARALGLRVPEDLSVIGYDDVEFADYVGLTTVRQQLFESGQVGLQLLLDAISDPTREPACVQMQSELVIRSTTAPPKRG
jgi:DNA-binding LacI/PurR family transcriptional regulator